MDVLLDTRKIRERREKLGLTLAEAASRAGFKSRQHWYLVEAGDGSSVTLATLNKVAKALSVSPKSLLT